ncbi:MAG: amidohydrolase [Planctomycetes bacterium]|nr:amidohydrolase [Planctomycetota bacterium]
MNRRTFLQSGAAAIAGVGLADLRADEGPADLDIIDCHTHFYDPTRPQGVPWPAQDSPLYRTVLPKHLREQKQFRPVTGTVVVEASPWVEDNAWLLELAKDDLFVVGVVGWLHPGEPEFAKQLKRFAANPLFRGIRTSVQLLNGLLERNELSNLKLLADYDRALDVNGGPETPDAIARLAARLPALRVVLNHIGNVRITADAPPREWRQGIQAAADHAQVYCKVSALVEGAARDGREAPQEMEFYRPYLDVVWDAFGDERVIYGSNWPVSDRAADYYTDQRIALEYAFEKGEAATRNFCSRNARRAYRWIDRPGRRS